MKKQTLRWAFKASFAVNVLLLVGVAWDYYRNGSALATPLLVGYFAFLVMMLLLFFAQPHGKASFAEAPAAASDDAVRLSIAERP